MLNFNDSFDILSKLFDEEFKKSIKEFCVELKRLKGTKEQGWEILKQICQSSDESVFFEPEDYDEMKLQYDKIYDIINCK